MTNQTKYLCLNCGNEISNEKYLFLQIKSYCRLFKFKNLKCPYCNENNSIESVDYLLCDTISMLTSKGYKVKQADSLTFFNDSYFTYIEFKKPLPLKLKPTFMCFSSVWKESENSISLDKIDGHIIFHRYSDDSNLQSSVIKISKDLFNWSKALPNTN